MAEKEIHVETKIVDEQAKKIQKLVDSIKIEDLTDTVGGENDGVCKSAMLKILTGMKSLDENCQRLLHDSEEYIKKAASEYEAQDMILAADIKK